MGSGVDTGWIRFEKVWGNISSTTVTTATRRTAVKASNDGPLATIYAADTHFPGKGGAAQRNMGVYCHNPTFLPDRRYITENADVGHVSFGSSTVVRSRSPSPSYTVYSFSNLSGCRIWTLPAFWPFACCMFQPPIVQTPLPPAQLRRRLRTPLRSAAC